MSRKGKIPIVVPKEVKVAVDGSQVHLEGPKGKMSLSMPCGIKVEQKDNQLVVTRANDTKQGRANHGTIRALLVNMVTGVTTGHKKEVEIQGIGYRAQLQGNTIIFTLGLSHQVEFVVPKELKVAVPKPTSIVLEGINKPLIGQVASKIRDLKRPEPYKGKGIRYLGEIVKTKQGKSVTK
ncbi:MAG TPA: 50S ribosomal protein L6 [Candidatus Omnitrophota bacterium]|nr:50S ribosomal protein L6 [Candidatus Omnitrophota bacterium]